MRAILHLQNNYVYEDPAENLSFNQTEWLNSCIVFKQSGEAKKKSTHKQIITF